jgi:hypothetical protein
VLLGTVVEVPAGPAGGKAVGIFGTIAEPGIGRALGEAEGEPGEDGEGDRDGEAGEE